jgi:hypothetical protein
VIFTPEHVALIQQGRKTQTRRLVKPDEKECRYQVGKAPAVQPGRGKPASCRITILAVRRERLGAISEKDAKREGYRTVYEFRGIWTQLHGAWTPDREVWVITFVLGDRTEKPRYLARRLGSRRGDYVDSPELAARGEGQALSEGEQEQMTAEARKKPKVTILEVWLEKRKEVEKALRELREHELDRDVERGIKLLEKQLGKIDTRIAEAA